MTVPMIVFTSGEDRGDDQQREHELQRLARRERDDVTCSAGIRVTTQIANALTTTRMRKRMSVSLPCERRTRCEGYAATAARLPRHRPP